MKLNVLSDKKCQTAKPKAKPYKIVDGHGLHLYITKTSKIWRKRYYFDKIEKMIVLGHYPAMGLAEAREENHAMNKQLREGTDPMAARRLARLLADVKARTTFEQVARDWHATQVGIWKPRHANNVMHKMETDLFPFIGERPIADISPPELLAVLKKIEARGANDIARRCKQISGQVFTYGMATGVCSVNIAPSVTKALKRTKVKHFNALDPDDIPRFLSALRFNDQRLFARTRRATLMLMHVFTRPTELTKARWEEFDLDRGIWTIPAERMKMGESHLVPLSRQVIEILREQFMETGHSLGGWVFPSQVRPKDHMSEGTVLMAIKRLGFDKKHTAHGFRAVARTNIREVLNYPPDVIEKQLAHAVGDNTQKAYNRTKFLDERRKMMQDWSDYIERMTPTTNVVHLFDRKPEALNDSPQLVPLAGAR